MLGLGRDAARGVLRDIRAALKGNRGPYTMTKNVDPNEQIRLNLPIIVDGFKDRKQAEVRAQSWTSDVWEVKIEEYSEPSAREPRTRRLIGGVFKVPVYTARALWRLVINLRPRSPRA